MSRSHVMVFAGLALSATSASGDPTGAAGNQYRLIGAGPASVAASAASVLFQAQLAGGSGAAVGIAASPNSSVVAGPVSVELPTDRIFRGEFED